MNSELCTCILFIIVNFDQYKGDLCCMQIEVYLYLYRYIQAVIMNSELCTCIFIIVNFDMFPMDNYIGFVLLKVPVCYRILPLLSLLH